MAWSLRRIRRWFPLGGPVKKTLLDYVDSCTSSSNEPYKHHPESRSERQVVPRHRLTSLLWQAEMPKPR